MSRSKFGEQLPLDFSVSASQRLRREQKRYEAVAAERPSLFAAVPADVDVSLHSPAEAVAQVQRARPSVVLGRDEIDLLSRWQEHRLPASQFSAADGQPSSVGAGREH